MNGKNIKNQLEKNNSATKLNRFIDQFSAIILLFMVSKNVFVFAVASTNENKRCDI